jgi:sodium/potassium-transporting ATPase subunit alpha
VYMLIGMLFETGLALFLIYVPGFDQFFLTGPLRFTWWLPPLVFAVMIFTYDEIRKWVMRRHPGCALEKETYW